MSDDGWEERMAARAAERAKADTDPGPMPTEPPVCCAEWFVDGPHGWTQRLICGYFQGHCNHGHHSEEVWMAAPPDGVAVAPKVLPDVSRVGQEEER